MDHTLKVLSTAGVTHDVRRIRLEKPEGFEFVPGQAVDVALNRSGWTEEKRPFTFTCLNGDPYLEFTIKCYMDHDGVTRQIASLAAGDELIISDPWGAISYQGTGYFIAGGAGITPFMAILRQLHQEGRLKGNKLFFSNKTAQDIIYEGELEAMLGDDAVFIVTQEKDGPYPHDFIDDRFLDTHIADFKKPIYICGPDPMVEHLSSVAIKKGADPHAVVFEK